MLASQIYCQKECMWVINIIPFLTSTKCFADTFFHNILRKLQQAFLSRGVVHFLGSSFLSFLRVVALNLLLELKLIQFVNLNSYRKFIYLLCRKSFLYFSSLSILRQKLIESMTSLQWHIMPQDMKNFSRVGLSCQMDCLFRIVFQSSWQFHDIWINVILVI